MSGATLGMGLVPPFASWGAAASLLMVSLRLVQGFCLGGELPGALTYVVETAPRRAPFVCGVVFSWVTMGVAFATGVSLAVRTWLPAELVPSLGWRLAFVLGGLVVPVGLAIRRSLPETLLGADAAPPPAAPGGYRRVALLGFAMLGSATIIGYTQTNLTTFAAHTLHMSAQTAFLGTLINALCMTCFDPVGGALSDRIGRKPVMIGATALLAACTYPAFRIIVEFHTPAALFASAALLGILTGLSQPPVLTALAESVPRSRRAGTVAIVYALAISLFGGSTQLIINWLIRATGNPLAPGWYMLGAAVIGVVSMSLMRESAPRALAAVRPQLLPGESGAA